MFCSKCGSNINEGAFFCDKCGNPVASVAKSTGNTPFPKMIPGSQNLSGNTQTYQQYMGGQPVINQQPQAAGYDNSVNNSAGFQIKGLEVLRVVSILMMVLGSLMFLVIRGIVPIMLNTLIYLTSSTALYYCAKAKNAKTKEEGEAARRKGLINCFLAIIIWVSLVIVAGLFSETANESRQDYENDMKILTNVVPAFFDVILDYNDGDINTEAMLNRLNAYCKSIRVRTPKGKQIKSDLQAIVKDFEKSARGDSEAYDSFDDLMDLISDLEDHLEDFLDAAEDSGVDEDDLEDFEDKVIGH